MTRPSPVPRLLALLAAAAVLVVALAAPAGAHGATATMGIEVTPGTAPLTARVRVLLEYANDGDVATGAAVVAEATGPDGTTIPAVPLADVGHGNYEAVLTMPSEGIWTVTVTATDPAATASATVEVVAPASGSFSGDLEDTDTAAADDARTSSDRAERESTTSDGGPSPALLATIAVVLVAGVGITFVLVRRR